MDAAALQKALALSPRPVMEAMLGLAQGLAGRKSEAQKIYDDMRSRQPPVSPYYLGILSLGLGDSDRAMQYFERAYEERDGILIYLAVDPVAAAAGERHGRRGEAWSRSRKD